MAAIKSVLELFPEAEIIESISETTADDANRQVKDTSGAGGPIFLGPQAGLKVIEVIGVGPSSALDDQQSTRAVLLWQASDRQSLENRVVVQKDKGGLRIGLLQLTKDTDPAKQFRKAGMMDLDLLIVGIVDRLPEAPEPLYGLLHAYAEIGIGVVGILDPSLSDAQLHHADYLAAVERMMKAQDH